MLLSYKDPKKKRLQIIEICLLLILVPAGLYFGNDAYQDWQKLQEAESHYREASYLLTIHRLPAAVAKLEKTVSIYPAYSAAWESLGVAHFLAKDIPAEVDAYRRATQALPEDGNLHRELGAAYHRAGEHEKELAALKKAEQLGTNDKVFLERLLARADREARGEISNPEDETVQRTLDNPRTDDDHNH